MGRRNQSTVPSLSHAIVTFFMSLFVFTRGYDIGCIYPSELGDDPIFTRFDLGGKLTELVVNLPNENEMTEPFMARFGLYVTGCTVLCMAYHDPVALDPLTKMPTFMTVPPFGQNAYSVTMCQAQCWQYVWEDYYNMMAQMKEYFITRGLQVTNPSERPDIESALMQIAYTGSPQEILTILENEDYHPFTVGHVAGVQVKYTMASDGFNADGKNMWCPATQQQVPCTANCRPFDDTIGYEPVPDPRLYSFLNLDSTKYQCTGYCRRWQPTPTSGTPTGSISRKEFTLPHIGFKAKTYLRDVNVTLENPNYDYYQESQLVVDRLRATSSDDYKKLMIKLFRGLPNKGIHGLRGSLQQVINARYSDQLNYEDNMLLFFALSLIEYDGIIQVWREKVTHDLVRPTTVINQWGTDLLNTFGGDINFNGPVDIVARSFGTVLPSIDSTSEFPSVTSCFCKSLAEFLDLYLMSMYGETLQDFTFVVPGEDDVVTFQNMEDYLNVCGQSMLWGGFHFPASITAGEEACSGLGALAAQYTSDVRNGSDFNGGWRVGDLLPACPGS